MYNFIELLLQALAVPLMCILSALLVAIPLTIIRIAWKVFKWAWSC
jgi:hypothetical protein